MYLLIVMATFAVYKTNLSSVPKMLLQKLAYFKFLQIPVICPITIYCPLYSTTFSAATAWSPCSSIIISSLNKSVNCNHHKNWKSSTKAHSTETIRGQFSHTKLSSCQHSTSGKMEEVDLSQFLYK